MARPDYSISRGRFPCICRCPPAGSVVMLLSRQTALGEDPMIEIQLIGATQVSAPHATFAGRDFGGVKPRRLLEVLALDLGT
ncbi:MAG: hypothetical protein AVDCRST_MAG16-2664, partial [uncultured Frankineae bacterium]